MESIGVVERARGESVRQIERKWTEGWKRREER